MTELHEILPGVRTLLAVPAPNVAHAPELEPLLRSTVARAVGCWRHEHGRLVLVGFLAVDEMPVQVQAEFVAAVRDVPLTATQFGVVQAVTRNGPAVNHRSESPDIPTTGSIGWLARLEAASSLAVPLVEDQTLIGALAVATAARIEPDDAVWRLLVSASAAPAWR